MTTFLRQDDDGFDEERTGFQRAALHAPGLIACVRNADEVAEALATGLPYRVQATGHGLRTPMTDGLLVSTRRMDGVRVDPDQRTARIEAGATWEPVIAAAAEHGLAPLSGSTPTVGAIGYTLGGGIGLMARKYGYAADHVRSIDLVTPAGELHHITDGDLFWALRGGRDGFGVVTAIEIDLFPVAELYGGGLIFPLDVAREVVDAWRDLTAIAPDELTSSIALVPHAGIVAVRIAHLGDDGERLLAPLRALGPRADTVATIPYRASHTIHNDPREPAAFWSAGTLTDDFDTTALLGRRCVVQVRDLRGALARQPAIPNAVAHRDSRYLIELVARVPAHEEFERILGQVERRGVALNFLNGGDPAAAFERDGWARLEALRSS